MIPLSSFLTPVLLSTVVVFIASCVIHMALRYHNSDYRKLPNEDEVRTSIRKSGANPGQYILPWCSHGKNEDRDATMKKFAEGPVGTLWIRATGPPKMGPHLLKWIAYCAVISVFTAYAAGRTLPRSAVYLEVFRVVGTVAFLSYSCAHWSDVIWKGKPVSCALKDTLDGLIYALLTAGVFGWQWPR